MKTYTELQLPAQVDSALRTLSLLEPSAFQAQLVPSAFIGRDICGTAQPGDDRSLTIAIPVVARVLKNARKTALILTFDKDEATRVIGMVQKIITAAGIEEELQAACVIPGMDIGTQIKTLLKRPRIIVGTPDRVVELLKKGACSLSSAEIVVFDGLDEMYEKDFAPQLAHVLRFVPRARQTLVFTTGALTGEASKVAAKNLKDPIKAEQVAAAPAAAEKKSTKKAPVSSTLIAPARAIAATPAKRRSGGTTANVSPALIAATASKSPRSARAKE